MGADPFQSFQSFNRFALFKTFKTIRTRRETCTFRECSKRRNGRHHSEEYWRKRSRLMRIRAMATTILLIT